MGVGVDVEDVVVEVGLAFVTASVVVVGVFVSTLQAVSTSVIAANATIPSWPKIVTPSRNTAERIGPGYVIDAVKLHVGRTLHDK